MTAILKVDTIQDTSGNNIINESSDTITIGASGDTTNIVGTLQNNGSALISGITEADQWRINSNLTTSTASGYFTANWERVDTDGFGKIGTGLTESSGVFSFPSTGVYLIAFDMMAYGNGGARPYFGVRIATTLDNSSYSDASMTYASSYTNGAYGSMNGRFQFNVTNVSTHKFKMGFETDGNSTIFENNSNRNSSNVTITRLGDSV